MNHQLSARATVPSLRRDDTNALIHRAAAGDQRAWSLLVGRFDATIRAATRRYRLSDSDRDEVAQRTWLAMVRHVDRLGDHPAVAGWLVTTAQRECLKLLAAAKREWPVEEPIEPARPDGSTVDEPLLTAERRDALHLALERVPEHERRLLRLLLREPAPSYDEISATLGIPKGSIGPTRGRCLERLRRDRHLLGVLNGTFRRPLVGHDLG